MQSKQVAKQQTKRVFELEQRPTKRRPSTLWQSFQQRDPHQISSSKALAATTEGRIGRDADPLRDGFQPTSLDQDEVERILDACIKHSDHWSIFKVAAMVLLGTAMGFRGDDLMDAKPSLLALTPVVRSMPVPMQTCHLVRILSFMYQQSYVFMCS
ncbi:TPA: hypothetical protein ACH3X1_008536 [Trebouxia sp. C0004]